MPDIRRLSRLARAKASLAQSLEARLSISRRERLAQEVEAGSLQASLERSPDMVAGIRSLVLRRLIDTARNLARLRASEGELEAELIALREQQRILEDRAKELRAQQERTRIEAEMVEMVARQTSKASRKADVIDWTGSKGFSPWPSN